MFAFILKNFFDDIVNEIVLLIKIILNTYNTESTSSDDSSSSSSSGSSSDGSSSSGSSSGSGSSSAVPQPAAAASGDLLKMYIFRPQSRSRELETAF